MNSIKDISFQFKCDEDWTQMKPCDGGRHCKVCNKTVFDFTDKSLSEYHEQLQRNQGDICGRFSQSQTSSLHHTFFGKGTKWLAAITLFASFTSCDEGNQTQDNNTNIQLSEPRIATHTMGAPVRSSYLNSDGKIGKVKKHDSLIDEHPKELPEEIKRVADSTKADSDNYDELGFVDPFPKYLHGGEEGMLEFLAKNTSIKDSVYGKVMVGFTVDKNGQVKDAKILRSLSPLNDSAVLNTIYKLEFEKQKRECHVSLPIIIEGNE